MRRVATWLASLACVVALVSGCASWDSPQAVKLSDELSGASTVDPRARDGVVSVDKLDEVEPVTDNPKPALPVELTDADGNDVTVTDTSRILALDLYGTYTKTLRGLGLGPNIVGRTVSSTEDSLADVPVVTVGGHDINVEAVLNLKPTLVIVDHSIGPPEAIEQIRAAGVPTVIMNPTRSLETLGTDIENVAGVVGLPSEGATLAKRSVDQVEEARSVIAGLAPETPLRMAFLYARGTGGVFYILGKENSTEDLIGALGGEDVAAESGIGAPSPASPEALAGLNPEVFVMMTKGLESTGSISGLLSRPGVAQTDAGQHSRVLVLPDGDSLAFGPQTGELLLRAAKALYVG
ncbi:heme/hemin ABC transporter substrate-binding protein [Corynebacterium pyruviciproducens]|uniref:heme/hemin ABC transporter substrate-binding protein n=1 Tax=Corynebacterium pyruviciproducens TaxID=598660 RepID=UPI00254FB344|nr:ABC transporter substrate-binding protein [Corynebacterium pyruviciproducens]MDK7214303.1 ABC transporter substrate-binding protein [Corynebacterium pyruviciproducens]